MKFSVLMSVYKNDKPEYLKESLDSIINQTVKPNEIVLVIDGPIPEDIENTIKEYEKKESIFKILRIKENSGLGNALREGLKECSYELVARMDADDICNLDRFEKQLKEFEKDPELSVIGGYIEEFIDIVDNKVSIREVPLKEEDVRKYIKSRCPLNHMTVMFKKEDVERCGSYMEWHYNEDYYLWLRMFLNNCKIRNIGEVLVHARVGKEMYQRRGGFPYFKQGLEIQKFMLKNKIIHLPRFIYNLIVRFVVQVLCPNSVRAFIYKKFIRKENSK